MSGLDEQVIKFPECECSQSSKSYIDLYCDVYRIGALFSDVWMVRIARAKGRLILDERVLKLYKKGCDISRLITRVEVFSCMCGSNIKLLDLVCRYLREFPIQAVGEDHYRGDGSSTLLDAQIKRYF